jgi:hypothetical protein
LEDRSITPTTGVGGAGKGGRHVKHTPLGLVAACGAALVVALVGGTSATGSHDRNPLKEAALGQIHAARLDVSQAGGPAVTRTLPFYSNSLIAAEKAALGMNDDSDKDVAADVAGSGDVGTPPDLGTSAATLGCSERNGGSGHETRGGGNVRVNQDCTYRRQAEEDITYNPRDPQNLVAGQNDSRVGFNQCGIDWSLDNGRHWGDMLPPYRSRINNPAEQEPIPGDPNRHTIEGGPGTFHTYDFASDPASAVDYYGRAYFSCVALDINYPASAVYVTQSPPYAKGSYYYNWSLRRFTVVEDNSEVISHDKNMISADRYRTSPNRGNVYVTWTAFKFGDQCIRPGNAAGYCGSPIFGSMSTDGGFHWSTPEEISGTSDTLCFFGDFFDPASDPHACDFDQGSYSVALPNGDLQVVFNSGNTAPGDPNSEILGVHCHPAGNSATGTASLNCVEPALVGRDITVGEPRCDFGRGPEECVPGPYIRTNDFPRITKDNTQNNHTYAVWQDYRNGEYDIQLSQSLDGGLTWHEAGTVNPDRGLDHYMPATDQSPDQGDRNGVSYYRSERVPNENVTPPEGFTPGVDPGVQARNSDYVLAGGFGANTPYAFRVVSPAFPPPDGNQAGFNGDYSGLTINRGTEAHPIWSDTRNEDPDPVNGNTHDEDVFTDAVSLPGGRGFSERGGIGKGGGDH